MPPVVERTMLPLTDLHPSPRNPRRISPSALQGLRQSIARFGLVQEIVVNRRTGHIVGGHQRVDLLRQAGETHAPVALVDLDEPEEMALNVALNNPGTMGEFTDDLSAILAELETTLPDAFDELRLFTAGVERPEVSDQETEIVTPEYDLSPAPYESYNYVLVIFKNDLDWTAAQDHFQLETVQDTYVGNRKRPAIGLGHVVDGGKYLERILRAPKTA